MLHGAPRGSTGLHGAPRGSKGLHRSTVVCQAAQVAAAGRRTLPPPLLVLLAIGSVQTGSAVARSLFDDLGAVGTALLRLVIAAAILCLVLRPPVRSWTRTQWVATALLGLALAGMNVTFYLSLDLIPLGVAVTVEYTGPLLLALFQTRRLLDFGWAILAGAGVALLGLHAVGGAVAGAGLVLAFVAGLCWVGYIVSSARVGRVLPGVDGLAVALVFAAIVVFPFGVGQASAVADHPDLLLGVIAVALLSSVVPYGLELVALRSMPTRVFGVLMSLQPAAAALSGWIILSQSLEPIELVALGMVSVASMGVSWGAGQRARAQRAELRNRPEEPGLGPIG